MCPPEMSHKATGKSGLWQDCRQREPRIPEALPGNGFGTTPSVMTSDLDFPVRVMGACPAEAGLWCGPLPLHELMASFPGLPFLRSKPSATMNYQLWVFPVLSKYPWCCSPSVALLTKCLALNIKLTHIHLRDKGCAQTLTVRRGNKGTTSPHAAGVWIKA